MTTIEGHNVLRNDVTTIAELYICILLAQLICPLIWSRRNESESDSTEKTAQDMIFAGKIVGGLPLHQLWDLAGRTLERHGVWRSYGPVILCLAAQYGLADYLEWHLNKRSLRSPFQHEWPPASSMTGDNNAENPLSIAWLSLLLGHACTGRYGRSDIDTIMMLLSKGADPAFQLDQQQNMFGCTAFDCFLISAKYQIFQKGLLAKHSGLYYDEKLLVGNYLQCLEALVDHGANVDTPLWFRLIAGKQDTWEERGILVHHVGPPPNPKSSRDTSTNLADINAMHNIRRNSKVDYVALARLENPIQSIKLEFCTLLDYGDRQDEDTSKCTNEPSRHHVNIGFEVKALLKVQEPSVNMATGALREVTSSNMSERILAALHQPGQTDSLAQCYDEIDVESIEGIALEDWCQAQLRIAPQKRYAEIVQDLKAVGLSTSWDDFSYYPEYSQLMDALSQMPRPRDSMEAFLQDCGLIKAEQYGPRQYWWS